MSRFTQQRPARDSDLSVNNLLPPAGRGKFVNPNSPYQRAGSASTSNFVNANQFSSSNASIRSYDPREGGGFMTQSSIAEKYSLAPSPAMWGTPLHMDVPEPDDALHNPDPQRDSKHDRGGSIFSSRGIANLGCLAVLALGITGLFAGFPIISHFTKKIQTTGGGFNLGGTNATGQVPVMPGQRGLIDKDTPLEVYSKKSWMNPSQEMILVFSDEFNEDGRTFYPGDDPYWEAVDLHYWVTNDLEWYDPKGATTGNGSLLLTLQREDPSANHDLDFSSGMIQSWNKFCFTGGIVEASIQLPGANDVPGLWPALWAMGNLGRAGHGASTDGMWPFSYDACDVGTFPNQTYPGTSLPAAAMEGGDPFADGELSYLPGQRLSACTCPGESHPGPVRPDGSYVGRSAPEIDVIEALIHEGKGAVSLSAQWAPYNAGYEWFNTSDNMVMWDEGTTLNEYVGGRYQQTTSGLSFTNPECYELEGGCFALYAFEYKPGFDDAYISWVNDNKLAWTLYVGGMAADNRVEISSRPIPVEPMYLIANLGFSHNFGDINFEVLQFPTTMKVDYIRVYQPVGAVNVGCNPDNFPTTAYIEAYKELYTNPNLTVWDDFGQPWPKNSKLTDCN